MGGADCLQCGSHPCLISGSRLFDILCVETLAVISLCVFICRCAFVWDEMYTPPPRLSRHDEHNAS